MHDMFEKISFTDYKLPKTPISPSMKIYVDAEGTDVDGTM